jgi:ATP-dependent Clp protease ATP-binding subunit ClpX
LGARGLRSICEAILNDAMFDIPSQKEVKEFRVDLEYASSKFAGSKMAKLKIA